MENDKSKDKPAGLTIGQSYIWANHIFSMTEMVAGAVPDSLMGWRPDLPAGMFHFSLAEIIMHITDGRRAFASQLSGEDYTSEYYAPHYWGQENVSDEELNTFRDYGSRSELLADLAYARALWEPYLVLPAGDFLSVPPGAQGPFDKLIADLKAQGVETAPIELHGPPNIAKALFAVVANESGHRGTLATLLQLNGIEIEG